MTGGSPVGYYQWLNFNSPMTSATADALVDQLAVAQPTRILDVGCGWGELLLRLVAACPEATGHGVDHDEALTDRAISNAADRGLSSRVSFGTALSEGRSADLVLNVGAEHVFGTISEAMARLFDLVTPGGQLLLATMIWEQPPTPALVESMGELPNLDRLIDDAVAIGWRPLGLKVSSPDDWDHFEFGYLRDWEQLVMNPTTPAEADEARRAADRHRADYLARRGILGFVFLTLGRPSDASHT